MKLVKQVVLVQANGAQPKVYEIDLCEVSGDRFVVNFRYGRRGQTLKDGSKTPLAVGRTEAERIYERLMWSKIAEGFVRRGDEAAAVAAPSAPAPRPKSDSRANHILEILGLAVNGKYSGDWELTRVIWRAGELGIADAERLLIPLLKEGSPMRKYCIAWALGRIGTAASLDPLAELYAKSPDEHVRRIAAEALLAKSDDATRREFVADQIAKLPHALADLARGDSPEAFEAAALPLVLQNASLLETLYLIDTPTTRPAFLQALATVPIEKHFFRSLRHIYKAAEHRRDARVFGILAYRFELTPALYSKRGWRRYHYEGKRDPYSDITRDYFRRRIWRTLRRLGEIGDPSYTRMAAGVLLPFKDSDAEEPRSSHKSHYDRVTRRYVRTVIDYGPFARYIALNRILYGRSKRHAFRPNRRAVATISKDAQTEREEAFPLLWNEAPAVLMQLLLESECAVVHEMAVRVLREQTAFLDSLEDDDVILLLARPYPITAELAFELAAKRYKPDSPNLGLVLAALECAFGPGRERAAKWIDEQREKVLENAQILAALVLSRHADVRQLGRRLLRSAVLRPATAEVLIGRIVAGMLALREGDDAIALEAADTVSLTLVSFLGAIGFAPIQDLLAHPLAGVQQLGVELLLRRDSRSGLIPVDLVLVVLHSPHENVRAAGLRLLAEVHDDVLATWGEILLRLSTDANADVRNASRALVKRALIHANVREVLANGLIAALLRRKLPEGAPSHAVRILREELQPSLRAIDAATVWRLLDSGSQHAQEIGGMLLETNVRAEDIPIERLVTLGSHEILSVRQASWRLFEQSIPRVKANMPEAVRVLDAKWQDSRVWARDFFRARFATEDFTADVLVSIADSIREDVQSFGRELLAKHFRPEDGPELLRKLAEHPSRSAQLFATNYLDGYASDDPAKLEALAPYFVSVLSRVNQGRIAKQRVIAFLEREGQKSDVAGHIVATLLHRIAATISVEIRSSCAEALVKIALARPTVQIPAKVVQPPVRGAS